MTEDEAREWLRNRVSRETMAGLDEYVSLLTSEATQQNLIAESTVSTIWSRHILDSAQLIELASGDHWVDLGSGAGFPGLVLAAMGATVTLIEARAKRVAFLRAAAETLTVADRVTIFHGRVESLPTRPFDVISARAFAPLPRLLEAAHPLSTPDTQWVLPKGRGAAQEVAAIAGTWQGDFRIVPSVTDPDAAIIVARDVRPRKRR